MMNTSGATGSAGPDDRPAVNLLTLVPTGPKWLYRHLRLQAIAEPAADLARRRFFSARPPNPGQGNNLETLGFLHFGRWVMLCPSRFSTGRRSLPHLGDGQPKETMRWGLEIFMSNFNSDWRNYVEEFMETAGKRLGHLWGSTPGWFPPEKNGYEEFFALVNRHVLAQSHYYAAYPSVETSDVKAALMVDREVRSFHAAASAMDDERWDEGFDALVCRLQRCLGTIHRPQPTNSVNIGFGVSDGHGFLAGVPAATQGTENVALTALCPFPKDLVQKLRSYLSEELQDNADSPFARVPGTHFARFAVFDSLHREGHNPVELESGYLLFGADADGPPRTWLEAVFEGFGQKRIDAIWGNCYGFNRGDDAEHFRSYVERTSFRATVPFADYPYVSLWDVLRALDTHEKFTQFVFSNDARRGRGGRKQKFEAVYAGFCQLEPQR